MTNHERTERTSGGTLGKLAGKAKEAAGWMVGKDDLAREGRLQQAQSAAEIDAQRHAAEAEQRQDEADLAEKKREVELEREQLVSAVSAQERAERERVAAAKEGIRLEQDARRAEAAANAMHDKENR